MTPEKRIVYILKIIYSFTRPMQVSGSVVESIVLIYKCVILLSAKHYDSDRAEQKYHHKLLIIILS
jgi:hypothetical protein